MTLEAGETLEPGRAHIIKRPRLTALLDESKARIILLVAPAGYGKTTLAREWLSARPHAWYRGTSAAADVAALALGLAKATATIVPGAGERMATRLRISSSPTEEAEALAELLADDLGNWPPDTWLAFDDYQFACDSELAERFVEHLASSCPIRLLAASRSRPSWATARRLLYGEIFEIGRNLLAMNQEEASSVLENHTANETEGLIALADGWPALIGLATLTEEPELPAKGLPDELYNYFAEELYQAISLDSQDALRRLSLAPSITPEMADSLAGENAAHIIDQAVKLGFFLAASRDRLEFHPLLRSFLSSKFVDSQDDPDGRIVTGLVHTLIGREEWDEAFDVVERFFDGSLLVELFEAALPRLVDEARLPTLVQWIHTANSHRVDSPVIDTAEAEVAFNEGEWRRAEALASQAVHRFPDGHVFQSKALWLAGMSAHLTSREKVAFEHFENAAKVARSDTDRRQALWGCFSSTAKLDNIDDAEALLTEIESQSGTTVDELLRVGTGRLMVAALKGRLIQALESVDGLTPLIARARDPLIQSAFLNVHAASLALGGRYSDACEATKREIEISMTYGLSFVVPHAQLLLAVGFFGLRDLRRCKTTLNMCEKARLITSDHFLRMNIGALRGRLCLASGSTSQALDVFERYRYPTTALKNMEAEYLAWWSLAHASAKHTKVATALADRAASMSPRIEVSGLIPWTQAVLAVNRGRSARPVAEEAFRIALDTGNIDAFVTAYRACPELLRLLVSNEANHDQLRTILERARDHALAESAGLRLPTAPEQDGPSILTRREREVLELVTQGLSNREIGRTLFITESTAKVHVRKICRKLGVRTRIEAVGRVSDLGA